MQSHYQQRDPPPYPGFLRHISQPGYRQSFSGSEASTDLSLSSTENLSTATRQDPQGEETRTFVNSRGDVVECDASILARLGMPGGVPNNGVEIHPNNCSTFYVTGSMHPPLPAAPPQCTTATTSLNNQTQWKPNTSQVITNSHRLMNPIKAKNINSTHSKLAMMMSDPAQYKGGGLPPPPVYPGNGNAQLGIGDPKQDMRRSYEMLDKLQFTRSQPDLTRLLEYQNKYGNLTVFDGQILQNQMPNKFQAQGREPDHAALATEATRMVELLSEENRNLKTELEGYYKKVSKLQKFEQEILKVHNAHEALVKQVQRRENLDKAMRIKLESEIRRQREINKQLKEQLEVTSSAENSPSKEVYSMSSDAELKKELSRKDTMITKLIQQSKELASTKERLEIELAAQRSTLTEQRKHIDVLDSALANTQNNVMRLEDELRNRKDNEERVDQLQKSYLNLQAATEKREQVEQRLRTSLQEEVRTLRAKTSRKMLSDQSELGKISPPSNPSEVASLEQKLIKKEQNILMLQAEVNKWEQRFYEEIILRQFAVDEASMPKDARIAALEKGSVETEKIIAEARTDKLKHLEEVYQANKRSAELEAKVKTIQAQLCEKDAMIKVLQKHSLSRAGSLSSLLCSPIHSPRPSITTPMSPLASRQNSQLDRTSSPVHSKSGSASGSCNSGNSGRMEKSVEDQLRAKLTQQMSLLNNLQTGNEQVSKHLWQV